MFNGCIRYDSNEYKNNIINRDGGPGSGKPPGYGGGKKKTTTSKGKGKSTTKSKRKSSTTTKTKSSKSKSSASKTSNPFHEKCDRQCDRVIASGRDGMQKHMFSIMRADTNDPWSKHYKSKLENMSDEEMEETVKDFYNKIKVSGSIELNEGRNERSHQIENIPNDAGVKKSKIQAETGCTQDEAEEYYEAIKKFTGASFDTKGPEVDKKVDEYIRRADVFREPIYRGMAFDLAVNEDKDLEKALKKQMKIGKLVSVQPKSWSSDPSVAQQDFGMVTFDGMDTVLIKCISSQNAAPIKHLSRYSVEDEVTVAANVVHTVVDSYTEKKRGMNGGTVTYLTVIEQNKGE